MISNLNTEFFINSEIAEGFDVKSCDKEEERSYFCKRFFPKTTEEKQNFTEIYFFAEALIFQLESFFVEGNKDWIKEHLAHSTLYQTVVKGLSQLIRKNEKRIETTKKITKTFFESINLTELSQAKKIIEAYNKLSKDKISSDLLQSLDPRKTHLKFKKSFSFFTKLSICLC